ncbi:MAG: glutamate mutase L [Chloroflexota bacterium]|nr:glutamate mutase L [Chloroflexota bacterium]
MTLRVQDKEVGRATAELSLLIDIGSAWTKAAVVGRTLGRWRIAAHAAQPTAWDEEELLATLAARLGGRVDPRVAVRVAALLADAPRIAVHTPARPGRIALAAVSSELSGRAARRAAEAAGWVVVEAITVDDGRPVAERLSALQSAEVDAWLVAGGFDEEGGDGALEMAGLVAAARGGGRSPVVWAGSASLTDRVAAFFDQGVVRAVPNPRPSAERENLHPLHRFLDALIERLVERGSARQLAPIGFGRAVAELARASRLRVVGVDIGARYATWASADEDGMSESRVVASGGLASPTLTMPGGPTRIAHSVPLAIDGLAVADALQNLRARPGSVPQTDEELAVVHGAARALLADLAGNGAPARSIDLLIGSGRTIAAAPLPAQSMQLLLDGVRPIGVVQVAIDSAGALGPLGALRDDEIVEGLGTLRDDLLTPLGAAVVCQGGRPGHPSMRVTVHRVGWPSVGPVEVRPGELEVLPLARGQVAELEIELDPAVNLGAPRRTRRLRATVSGGAVGLVLDARDAPLLLPRRNDDRRAVLTSWRDAFLREARPPAEGLA